MFHLHKSLLQSHMGKEMTRRGWPFSNVQKPIPAFSNRKSITYLGKIKPSDGLPCILPTVRVYPYAVQY